MKKALQILLLSVMAAGSTFASNFTEVDIQAVLDEIPTAVSALKEGDYNQEDFQREVERLTHLRNNAPDHYLNNYGDSTPSQLALSELTLSYIRLFHAKKDIRFLREHEDLSGDDENVPEHLHTLKIYVNAIGKYSGKLRIKYNTLWIKVKLGRDITADSIQILKDLEPPTVLLNEFLTVWDDNAIGLERDAMAGSLLNFFKYVKKQHSEREYRNIERACRRARFTGSAVPNSITVWDDNVSVLERADMAAASPLEERVQRLMDLLMDGL